MIYLDHAATSMHKPAAVGEAMLRALQLCGNPGRGGHRAAMLAAETVLTCRERAAEMFRCEPEQVVFTGNCTHGLNIAIRTLVKPGSTVVISGFEHNAVTRPLHGLGANIRVAGRRLFDWEETLESFQKALKAGATAAVFTYASNVFGYVLPVQELAALCRQYRVPFVIDAAQAAGTLPISMDALGADFIAMPGHKGLLGPQGTGMLLCNCLPEPLLQGGTGSASVLQQMPQELPDRAEPGTLNVPGIAGLSAGLAWLQKHGLEKFADLERREVRRCVQGLQDLGCRVFFGESQCGTVSFLPPVDCEELAQKLGERGIAVRSGLHCAPLAHASAGTLDTGTVRVSYGPDATPWQTRQLLATLQGLV